MRMKEAAGSRRETTSQQAAAAAATALADDVLVWDHVRQRRKRVRIAAPLEPPLAR